jgi:ABC-type antimicrobial peptide transport system permease subunit
LTSVLFRARTELRSRWRAWAALAAFLGVFPGAVMAVTAGARRTDSSYKRFLTWSHAWDVLLPDYPADFAPAFAHINLDTAERLPQVAESLRVTSFQTFGGPEEDVITSADPRFGTTFSRPKVLSGRLPRPDRADEVALSFTTAQDQHFRIGDVLHLTIAKAGIDPTAQVGLPVTLTVVGIEASPGEFPPTLGNTPALLASRAFALQYQADLLHFEDSLIRLKRGAADLPAFQKQVDRLSGGRVVFLFRHIDQAANIERSFHLQALALWLLAAITGLVTLLVFSQTLARQTFLESQEYPTLRALGMTRGGLAAVGMIRAGVVALAGAAVAAVTAAAASPFFPRGIARIAEPHPGFSLDMAVVGIGTAAMFVATALLQAIPAWRATAASGEREASTQVRSRPSVAGVRLALEPGRGRSAVPVRTSIVGVTLGIAGLVAAVTFGTSLDHLLHTPRLYGVTWDVQVSAEFGTNDAEEKLLPAIRTDPRVAGAVAGAISVPLEVDGHRADAVALAGDATSVYPPLLEGRPAHGSGEIVLGSKTLHQLGKAVGDVVSVNVVGTKPGSVRVVGAAVIPPIGDIGRFGEGALVPYEVLQRLVPEAPPPNDVLVKVAPGADRQALVRSLRQQVGPQAVADPQQPSDLVNFGRVQNMPLVLTGVLGLLAAATLAHMLVTAVLRRRRDLAVMKTLGFVRRQMWATVAWQASTLAVVALIVGMPLGVAGGRWAWSAFANQSGILPESSVSVPILLLAIPATFMLANLMAGVPGRIAARMQPAQVLRTE